MKRRKFILCLAGTAAAGLTGWKLAAPARGQLVKVTRNGWALGTNVSLTVFHTEARQAEKALDLAFAELDRVEDVMSLYRPESALCQLNRTGSLDNPHPYLVEVLETALDLSRRTEGAFDVTVQPLFRTYFEHAQAGRRPSAEAIQAALAKVGWRRIGLRPGRVELVSGTELTLNGIAQGFAADAVGRVLRDHGIHHALVDTGEIGTIGTHAEREHWSIGIKHPRKSEDFLGLAALQGRCLATSGDYETRFSEDYRHHHLLDPHTGDSPTELASVSVAAPTALQADALSTAVFLMGPARGRQLIESTPGTDALFVSKNGQPFRTAGFPLAG